ncbi:MAG: DUF4974 domain-containing protein [Sphingobacteriales bacterium]|nr:MAG: DUF4974 domain-containing protein [Sphingobacteriales bacterium]
MDRYQHFQIADFISDEYFVSWVLKPDSESNLFWNTWITENEQQADTVASARIVLSSVRIQPLNFQLSEKDVKSLVENFQLQTQLKAKKMSYIQWFSATAAAVLVFTGIWFWLWPMLKLADTRMSKTAPYQKIKNTGQGSRLIRLSDKSLVLLRPESELGFPTYFGEGNRTVQLSGEAFFEVNEDPSHPFLVKAGKLTTRVLGTSFDVVSSEDGSKSSVLVKTGKVQVYSFNQGDNTRRIDSVVLLPNQKVTFNPKIQKLQKISIVKPQMLSPVLAKRIFSFTEAPLSEIIASLQEAYGVEITYDDQKLRNPTVTASLSTLSLEEKIRAICKAIGANYEFQDNKINIY